LRPSTRRNILESRGTVLMRTCNYVLVSLATFGCIVAQEPNSRQKTEPGKLDFTFPPIRPLVQGPSHQKIEPGRLDFTLLRRPVPEKRFLDFTFSPIGPPTQEPSSHQKIEPGKVDFTLRARRRPVPQKRLLRPNGQIRLVENPSPCSIPLLEAQIPKDRHFFIEQTRPRMDKLAPMPNVNVPAPSCADTSGAAPSR